MTWFIVDRRDKLAQRVTEDAEDPTCGGTDGERYVKLWAESTKEAFEKAGPMPGLVRWTGERKRGGPR